MNKIWLFLLFSINLNGNPISAQNQIFHTTVNLASATERFLGLKGGLRSSEKGKAKFSVNYDSDQSSSQLAINYDEYNQLTFDESYFQYTMGIVTLGMGANDRHWSFSKKSSLILSHNARPFKSVYLKLKNEFKNDWMHSKADWSFEVFNGFTKRNINGGDSMLLGARAVLSPIEGLNFELVQTSQWGGKGYSNGASALGAALLFDTNNSKNSNINKMAGIGISYLVPADIIPLRIYGQAIGEDEAGNLPSCYAYLAGLEWSNTKIKYPLTIGIESVDTRTNLTSQGNCGPNTMYNNNTYNYMNYGSTMGTEIDSEGRSIELFGQSQISQKINIRYSSKLVTINDTNWAGHRLSSKRQSGFLNSLGFAWVKNNTSFNGDIYNQGFSLEKANIKSGYGVSFSSSIKF